ncbi:hypothetical protein SCHPADRAFT_16261 [Schizopora paradoxa]|uniref:Uncharacterized protein n=1 Tax=Schizopora paradoxa TaxID=27342 RepID=A0A0H2SU55_9AGAM|nr:hypothetical protein SCHPADRAFT_16261 [Schizopora paradoxa]
MSVPSTSRPRTCGANVRPSRGGRIPQSRNPYRHGQYFVQSPCGLEDDWSIFADIRPERQTLDSIYSQTVSYSLPDLGHYCVPYHGRQTDERREVLHFASFNSPASVSFEMLSPVPSDGETSVVVVVEGRKPSVWDGIVKLLRCC